MIPERPKRIRWIFDEALELCPEERASFLVRECRDELERRDVDELLAALEQPSIQLPSLDPAAATAEAPERLESMLIGKQVGQFHVRRLIGRGGMGTVYEAMQERPRRVVALKMVSDSLAAPSRFRRFEYEVQTLARLQHPGIAQIFEAGTHQDGMNGGTAIPYFAMEYVRNARTLTEYADQQNLNLQQRLELFVKVCEAVAHGQQHGIIHRDLKPGNILIDSAGQPKVIDFGVARAVDSDLAPVTFQTSAGTIPGTIQYMSPEHCKGDPHDMDVSSDVYSLGVVLYELLCHRLPYKISSITPLEALRSMRTICETPPMRPSSVDSTLGGDVEAIVLKALAKDRTRRYASASEFGSDIQRFLNREPIIARPPSVTYLVRVFARRNRAVFAIACALLAAIGLSVVLLFAMWQQADKRAQVTRNGILWMQQQITASLESKNQQDVVRALVDGCARFLDSNSFKNDQPGDESRLRLALGQAYQVIGDYAAAEEQFQRMIDQEQATNDLRTSKVHAIASLASMCRERARDSDDALRAEDLYRNAMELTRQQPDRNDRNPAIWSGFADLLSEQGRCTEAATVLGEALDLCAAKFGGRDDHSVFYMVDLANVYARQGQYEQATSMLVEALDICDRTWPQGQEQQYRTQRSLASVLRAHGNATSDPTDKSRLLEQARTYQQLALQGYERDLGDNEGGTLLTLEVGALIDRDQGHVDQAEQALARVAGMAAGRISDESQCFAAKFRTEQAICLARVHRFPEAEAILLEAYRFLQNRFPNGNRMTQKCIRALVDLYEASGDPRASQWKDKIRDVPCI